MTWLTVAKFLAPSVVLGLLYWYATNQAYDRGVAAADKTCAETTVPAAEAAVQTRCDANTKLTQEITNALRTSLADLDTRYRRLLGQKPVIAQCQPLVSPSAGRSDVTDAEHQRAGRVGINTEWLDAKFYDANHDALVGASCQAFVKDLYTLYGQQNKLPATAK